MTSKQPFQNIQQALGPKLLPMGWVLKYDPPVIGLIYKRNKKENKKHLYQIHLNNLIFLTNAQDITKQLFFEHPHFLNPNLIKPEQVLNLVMKLLDYKNQRLKEMAEFMQDYDGQGEEEYEEGEYEMDDQEIQYENLTEEQLFHLYQEQMQQQKHRQFALNIPKASRDHNNSF